MPKAYMVGGGIAGLSAAVLLIREAGWAGENITIFTNEDRPGGSLDAAGDPDTGYTMRGGRMFEVHFECLYDLLGSIPSIDDPNVSVKDDTFTFHAEYSWDDQARLVDASGRIVPDFHDMGFSERDRLDLIACSAGPEHRLSGKRITDCFASEFFTTNFWYMWCTTFAFEPWHSAMEFRRYLNRFVHLFKRFATMAGIYKTRYNQYDSIARPILNWLADQGVRVRTGVTVTDLELTNAPGMTVQALEYETDGRTERIEVDLKDLVFFTSGSMTANTSRGTTDAAPGLDNSGSAGAWRLWHKLAAERPGLAGDPSVFDSHIQDSTWESVTITTDDPLFFELFERFTDRPAGKGGLVTFKDSNWLLTTGITPQPQYWQQPEGTWVWWFYGLYPEKTGNHINKKMSECTGRELLEEFLHHLPFEQTERDRILDGSIVIPAMMPYITSQFLVRKTGDRPDVVPEGSTNLAFIGQFAEVPDDVVFTVEYSVRTAWTAVHQLTGRGRTPPPVYKGQHNPKVLIDALETMHHHEKIPRQRDTTDTTAPTPTIT